MVAKNGEKKSESSSVKGAKARKVVKKETKVEVKNDVAKKEAKVKAKNDVVKKETKEESGWATYTRSRNLITPVPKKKIIKRKRWATDPKPKKGYYIVKDSIVNGFNPVTDYPYQHYTMRLIEPGGDSS